MADRKYTEEHEWVEVDGETGMIGISDYAQEQLGDVVFVELPDVGKSLGRGDEAAVVESVKAAAEVYAPVGGEVIEVNSALNGDPSLVNSDAFGDGWFAKLRLTDSAELDELMDEAAYRTFCEGLG
ncbi:MAG: glycine cleavage system protein H [Alphaproteobacteria bacterium]|nr:glycine cleavage system protein H [Alphaproteobacteria bacterium]HCP00482.1 glycine cleavage system protein GcvH [Rhodospirillaceae bacterium]